MTTYPIDRHLKYRALRDPMFGPDDDSIFFRRETGGQYQVWELEQPRRWPRQWTFTDTDVTFASWSPTDDKLALGMEGQGDERTQLFYVDRDTKEVTRLTDDPDTIHRWGGWSRDGSTFAYAANRRDSGVFDVYTQDIDPSHEQANLVYEHDRRSQISAAGWGPNNERLLLQEMHSNFNMDLHIVSLETGDDRLVTSGEDDEARYRNASWGPDGESLYLVTDRDYNWLYVGRLDLQTRELEPVLQSDANIRELSFHAGRQRMAFVEYDQGFSDIGVADLESPTELGAIRSPDLPKGTAESLTMNSDASLFATIYYTPSQKPDIYAIDVENDDIVQWTDTNTPVPEDSYVTPKCVTYESFDGLEIPSIYTEPDDVVEKPLPAIIHLHGGPQKRNTPTFDPLRQFHVERGYVWFEPNYRGSSGFGKQYRRLDDVEKRPDAIKDIEMAAKWLGEHDRIDADRVALQGVSYGGYMVLRAMTNWPDLFAAGIALSPIVNFETFLEQTGAWRRANREAEYGSLEEDRQLLRDLSPIHDIDSLDAPLFVAHGENDPRVPIEEAKQVIERTEDTGAPVESMVIADAGHVLSKRAHRLAVFRRSVEFLEEHLD